MTVIITAYNQARFLPATLASVAAQDYERREVILVDDGSTDDTPAAIGPFRQGLTYVRQVNRGVAASRNTGIRRASGDLLAFLDGDDLWEPGKLSAQVEAARRYPESGLIAANGAQFDDTEISAVSLFAPAIQRRLDAGPPILTTRCYPELLERCPILTTSQVMLPGSVVDAVGLSDESLRISSDYDLYLRIAAAYPLTFLNQRLVRWRYLATSASGPRHIRRLHWTRDDVRTLRKQLRAGPEEHRRLIRDALARRLREAAHEAYYYGRSGPREARAWAKRYLRTLFVRNPTSRAILASLIALYCSESAVRGLAALVRRTSWPSS